ncbi:hypothetical protein BDSB_02810 [Burkholderia dolosa PC543]|nr:hypothetical protein BDSB_02810 [Burkholderia dolosa PC543]
MALLEGGNKATDRLRTASDVRKRYVQGTASANGRCKGNEKTGRIGLWAAGVSDGMTE